MLDDQKPEKQKPLLDNVAENCAGAQNQDQLVEKYTRLILGARRETALEECRRLVEANDELDSEHQDKLLEKIDIDRSGYQKRLKVGKDPRLQDPNIRPYLPTSITSLHELSCMDDNELTDALRCGVIGRPRREIRAYRASRRGQTGNEHLEGQDANVPVYAEVRLTSRISDDDHEIADQLLVELAEIEGVDIRYPQDDAEDRETEKINRRIDLYLRRNGKKRIQQIKREKLMGRPRGTTQTDWQRQKWPFSEEEIQIGPDASLERVREVFERLKMAGEFKQLLDGAYQHVRQRKRAAGDPAQVAKPPQASTGISARDSVPADHDDQGGVVDGVD